MSDVKILIVDDEEIIVESVLEYFSDYMIFSFNDSIKALSKLKNNYYDIVIVDYKMPGINGLDLLLEAKKHNNYKYGILLTAFADKHLLKDFINKSLVHSIFNKPLKLQEFKPVLDQAIEFCIQSKDKELKFHQIKNQYEETLKRSGFLNEKIIGVNGGLKTIFDKLDAISSTDENVLITGESGTGKEVLARSIHSLSNRKDNPFIKVNCGAIPENLIESELFGHKKGAFSGAYEDKPGKVELAHTGTLFLDEIGELKPEMQTRFLQVIQEKQVERVGSNQVKKVDFRLVCATNKDLQECINNKVFREDLYFRINTINLHMPPLRERKEDLEELISYLLEKYCFQLDRKSLTISNDGMNFLVNYKWPGNVREMENVIKRAIILQDKEKKEISSDSFTYLNQNKASGSLTMENAVNRIIEEIIMKKYNLVDVEKIIINKLLDHFDDNVMNAVKNTGISKNKFYRNR